MVLVKGPWLAPGKKKSWLPLAAGWLVGCWFVGRQAGWLAGWLAGWFIRDTGYGSDPHASLYLYGIRDTD